MSSRRRRPARRASGSRGDVREPEDAERIVRFCLERCGRLDALVNNAGGQYFVPAEAIEPKGWRAVHRLNVGGTELMSRRRGRARLPAGGRRDDRQRHAVAASRPAGHDALERRAGRGRGPTRARARASGRAGDRGRRRGGGPLRHRVAAQVPRAGAGGRRRAPCRCSGWAARRSTRGWSRCVLAARPRAVGLGDHARRRARQLVRPLAAAGRWPATAASCRQRNAARRRPDGGYHGRDPAGEVLWLHRSLPSF